MSKVFKVVKNKLVFSETGGNAVAVGLFLSYNRKFGGDLQNAETTKKYFNEYLEQRPDFQKLPPLAKQRLVLYFMELMLKGAKL